MNADKVMPSIEIEIGGKRWNIEYNFNAACEVERLLPQLNAFDIKGMFENLNATKLRAYLYAVLKNTSQGKDLTLEEVGSWITFENLEEIGSSVAKAVLASLPKAEEGQEKK